MLNRLRTFRGGSGRDSAEERPVPASLREEVEEVEIDEDFNEPPWSQKQQTLRSSARIIEMGADGAFTFLAQPGCPGPLEKENY